MSNPLSGWIALKHKTSKAREWCISPKEYFDKNGHIPDGHANLNLPGVDEVMDHTLLVIADGDDRAHLQSLGFEIVHHPAWYYNRGQK